MAEKVIRNIVFDFGGVLVDLDRDESVRRFLALGVHDADELLDPYLQRDIFYDLEVGRLSAEQFELVLSERYGRPFSHEEVGHAIMGFLRALPRYKYEYLRQLSERYRLFILSNTNPYIMERVEHHSLFAGDTGLSGYVEHLYASYRVGMLKPDLALYHYLLDDAGLIPEETLFLDDGVKNIEAAESIGIQGLLVENGSDWRPLLDQCLTEVR